MRYRVSALVARHVVLEVLSALVAAPPTEDPAATSR